MERVLFRVKSRFFAHIQFPLIVKVDALVTECHFDGTAPAHHAAVSLAVHFLNLEQIKCVSRGPPISKFKRRGTTPVH